MLSYVLLISLALIMAAMIYYSLRLIANVEPVSSCEDGTSLLVDSYTCSSGILSLVVYNNGKFAVNGFVITASDDPKETPVTPLLRRNDDNPGYYFFGPINSPSPLQPQTSENAEFSVSSSFLGFNIGYIRIQPFILSDSNTEIVCEDSIIFYEIQC